MQAWRGVAWRGVAWRGVAWRGVAWHGMAWHGMAWHGMPSVVLHRFVFSLRCTCIVLSCIRVVFQLRVM